MIKKKDLPVVYRLNLTAALAFLCACNGLQKQQEGQATSPAVPSTLGQSVRLMEIDGNDMVPAYFASLAMDNASPLLNDMEGPGTATSMASYAYGRKKRVKKSGSALPLAVDGLPFTLKRMSFFVLPGQVSEIIAEAGPAMQAITAKADKGTLVKLSPGRWRYTAPATDGTDLVELRETGTDKRTLVKYLVLLPGDRVKGGKINNYRIGMYQAGVQNPIYTPPPGYFEVLGENADDWLTDHVCISDVVCKQTEAYPRYMYLQARLLVKLEAVLTECHRSGIKASRFSFISGYRTPYYNSSIENVGLSRHQYGDAADIYIDQDQDAYLDDLNHDGRQDFEDTQTILAVVDRMDKSPIYAHLKGGCGVYHPKGTRTPFVHIDARGQVARWVN